MLKTVFLVTLLACVITDVIADYNIVCYYNRRATYRPEGGKFELFNINSSLCTHIIYNYVGITNNSDIKILDPWTDLPSGRDGFRKFIKLHATNPDVKLMIAIGGWDEGSINFSQVVGNSVSRAQFVENIINFLEIYNFDGLDLNWQFPNQRGGKLSDKQNYVAVLQELKQEFDKRNYTLSVTTVALEALASHSYIISQVSQYVDFINLMTYDFHGSWDRTVGIHAPLYASSNESGGKAKMNVNSSVQYWLSQGAPANKINLGISSYGRSFTLSSRSHEIGAYATGGGNNGPYTQKSGFLGYNEICMYLQKGWTVVRESQQHVPYAFKGNQWVGYDDVTSIEEKAKYAKSMGLGGMMLWSLDTDDFHGTSGKMYPLLNTINRVLTENTFSTSSPSLLTTPFFDPICTHEGNIAHPYNCTIYYICRKVGNYYMKYSSHCLNGSVYNPVTETCDRRSNVPNC
ncbi:Chitotriosidase-1 [Eufriesea mexicana]|uniref:Chitotriosidase-1 n=1 Tax=Eufriesea mexicana TaxID=516756 RepID=A0A310SJ01_9HYME|nr:PREDICTED: chitinase-3-like protein 1 [Eufriesea mexicana]OAD59337.1 Chitotriosidase-1 [Eufriesea mexicana]